MSRYASTIGLTLALTTGLFVFSPLVDESEAQPATLSFDLTTIDGNSAANLWALDVAYIGFNSWIAIVENSGGAVQTFVSDDDGASWEFDSVIDGSADNGNNNVQIAAVNTTTWYAAFTDADTDFYVYKTTDAGGTWTQVKQVAVDTGNTNMGIAFDARRIVEDDTLILGYFQTSGCSAGTSCTFGTRSTDGGATWSSPVELGTCTTGTPCRALGAWVSFDGTKYLVAGQSGVFGIFNDDSWNLEEVLAGTGSSSYPCLTGDHFTADRWVSAWRNTGSNIKYQTADLAEERTVSTAGSWQTRPSCTAGATDEWAVVNLEQTTGDLWFFRTTTDGPDEADWAAQEITALTDSDRPAIATDFNGGYMVVYSTATNTRSAFSAGDTDGYDFDWGFRCSDGYDNDGDGLVDWPDDPGCSSSFDDWEVGDGDGGGEPPADNGTTVVGPPGLALIREVGLLNDGFDLDDDGRYNVTLNESAHRRSGIIDRNLSRLWIETTYQGYGGPEATANVTLYVNSTRLYACGVNVTRDNGPIFTQRFCQTDHQAGLFNVSVVWEAHNTSDQHYNIRITQQEFYTMTDLSIEIASLETWLPFLVFLGAAIWGWWGRITLLAVIGSIGALGVFIGPLWTTPVVVLAALITIWVHYFGTLRDERNVKQDDRVI